MTDDIMNKMTSAPYSLVRSGYYNYSTGALSLVGTAGYLWSSTANSADSGYYLTFSSDAVYPGTGGYYKGAGFPVRCVAI